MAASSTDTLNLGANNFSTTLSSAITSSATSIPLTSVTNLPTTTGIVLVIDRVNTQGTLTPTLREYVKGAISSNNLVLSSTAYRGLGGSTAQAHSSGAVVEMVWDQTQQNGLINALLTTLDQTGAILPASVTNAMLAGGITGSNLANATITDTQIASATITGSNIAANTVTGNNLVGANLWGVGAAPSGSPPPAKTGQFYIQAGDDTMTFPGTTYNFTFPVAFPNGLVTMVVCNGDTTTYSSSIQVHASGLFSQSGVQLTSAGAGVYRVSWIAIGY